MMRGGRKVRSEGRDTKKKNYPVIAFTSLKSKESLILLCIGFFNNIGWNSRYSLKHLHRAGSQRQVELMHLSLSCFHYLSFRIFPSNLIFFTRPSHALFPSPPSLHFSLQPLPFFLISDRNLF